ncbi:hypothetical protein GCM10023263_59340 [Phytohabitans rumicis]
MTADRALLAAAHAGPTAGLLRDKAPMAAVIANVERCPCPLVGVAECLDLFGLLRCQLAG